MTAYDADDLFAGPGGWDVACRWLGLEALGYELDASACATRRAAGLATVQGDVREADPLASDAPGLIASPPCQTFSMAGKGAGRASLDRLAEALSTGWWHPLPGDDDRTILVLEPYRWIHQRHAAGRPYEWIAFEQVAPVLPVWETYAKWLGSLGYETATGVLNAEQYGVPQTRRRAVLLARLGAPVALPRPTHSRYHSRSPERLDGGVKPWVSMAEALGWAAGEVVGFPRRADGVGESVTIGGEDYRARDLWPTEGPAQGVTAKARSWQRLALLNGSHARAAVRLAGEPAPTIAIGHDAARKEWVGLAADGERPTHAKDLPGWSSTRPATTVNCDPRISRPGRHEPTESGSQQRDAVKVSVAEAAVLQTFPADYPWQGSRTAQFQQIGNAVPPLLAAAILAELVNAEPPHLGERDGAV